VLNEENVGSIWYQTLETQYKSAETEFANFSLKVTNIVFSLFNVAGNCSSLILQNDRKYWVQKILQDVVDGYYHLGKDQQEVQE
jgi:hypothetical protein